jgi:hypothetical protein
VIRDLHATPGTDADFERGLVAFLRFRYGDVLVDGVTLRRHSNGTIGLSWPERTDRAGRKHPLIRPVNDEARRQLEHDVLRELSRRELENDRANPSGERKP